MAEDKPARSDGRVQEDAPRDQATTNTPDLRRFDVPHELRSGESSNRPEQEYQRSRMEAGTPYQLPRWLGATLGGVVGAAIGAGVIHQIGGPAGAAWSTYAVAAITVGTVGALLGGLFRVSL
jgi:hypothetical protein